MPNKPSALLLTPGASAGRDQPSLVAVDRAVSALGLKVARIDFPYRLAGRKFPDPAHVLVETVDAAAHALVADTSTLVLGGRSMGGRMCSVAVAEGLVAAGLVLISYPLHPPGRPDRLRTEHFAKITVPCLFVSGTRDPFGTPDELEAATGEIKGAVTHSWIDGNHGLRGKDAQVAAVVAEWISGQVQGGGSSTQDPPSG